MNTHKKIVIASLLASLLSACGGGSSPSTPSTPNNPATPSNPVVNPPVVTPPANPPVTPDPNPVPPVTPPIVPVNPPVVPVTPVIPVGATLTKVTINNTSTVNQSNVPVTFGQLFKEGELSVTEGLVGKLSNGDLVPLQLNVKATHTDGSVRHAIISVLLPTVGTSAMVLELSKTALVSNSNTITPQELINKGFTAGVSVNIGGVVYTANAQDVLTSNSTKWLSGNIANEWIVSAPLKSANGSIHPHLNVQFAVRYFAGTQKAKVDFTIENDWAYEPSPHDITYDATLTVGGQNVYTKAGLNQFHHTRWRKVFWWNGEPQIHVGHDATYLMATKGIPNYDPTVKIDPSAIAGIKTAFTGTVTEPMGSGLAASYMPMTGGRWDIGLIPGWAVSYLLTMDQDSKKATLGTADLSGSWSLHYRDKNTGKPVDLFDYPYMTILGNPGDTYNPSTQKYESFPTCTGTCSNTNTVDTSHAPNFAYLPYVVTGDYYYLEELEFWAQYDAFSSNPGYRDNIKGLVSPDQVRGQAWSLRVIGEAGYILPDNDPMKAHFKQIIANNLNWYNTTYTNNPSATLGAITNGYALGYNNGTGLAPWQDDFFTSAIGHLVELGYTDASPLLSWKAKFAVNRMNASGMCWIMGSLYSLNVRATATSPFFTDWSQIYQANVSPTVAATACASDAMAQALAPDYQGIKAREMVGYSYSNTGYPSNYQPALAYSVNSGIANSAAAWQLFMSRTTLPDYQNGAQFAIVPRK
jgi:hypothetical protein